jgi:hypothetical protein
MKQLDRLLFLQANCCFFCGQTIPRGESSVEHLVATSNGGTKADDNCVVCCKTLNLAFGHISLKAKLQAVLNQPRPFRCPSERPVAFDTISSGKSDGSRVAHIVANLHRRGAARPRRIATLKNTMNAAFQQSLSEPEIDELLMELINLGYVTIDGSKVTYALPPLGA